MNWYFLLSFHIISYDSLIRLVHQARLCPNSIVNSDFTLPLKISKFCKEIHAGFGLLNLKNDSLRKRFDGMKVSVKPTPWRIWKQAYIYVNDLRPQYDIKKMEECECIDCKQRHCLEAKRCCSGVRYLFTRASSLSCSGRSSDGSKQARA